MASKHPYQYGVTFRDKCTGERFAVVETTKAKANDARRKSCQRGDLLVLGRSMSRDLVSEVRFTTTEITLELSLSLDELAAFDKQWADHLVAEAERKVAFEAQLEAERVKHAAETARLAAGWQVAEVQLSERRYQKTLWRGNHVEVTGQVTLLGPTYESTRYNGEVVTGQYTGRVDYEVSADDHGLLRRRVNWSAWGNSSVESARAYARAILAACDEAEAIGTPTEADLERYEAALKARQEEYDRKQAEQRN